MEVVDGWFYVGTFDFSYILKVVPELIDLVRDKAEETNLTNRLEIGGDLYKTRDGITWYPVFTTGLSDPNNYGIRNLLGVDGDLYVGFGNPHDGLEIWKASSESASS